MKTRDLILSLSKDEAKISCLFSSLLALFSAMMLKCVRKSVKRFSDKTHDKTKSWSGVEKSNASQ